MPSGWYVIGYTGKEQMNFRGRFSNPRISMFFESQLVGLCLSSILTKIEDTKVVFNCGIVSSILVL